MENQIVLPFDQSIEIVSVLEVSPGEDLEKDSAYAKFPVTAECKHIGTEQTFIATIVVISYSKNAILPGIYIAVQQQLELPTYQQQAA